MKFQKLFPGEFCLFVIYAYTCARTEDGNSKTFSLMYHRMVSLEKQNLQAKGVSLKSESMKALN